MAIIRDKRKKRMEQLDRKYEEVLEMTHYFQLCIEETNKSNLKGRFIYE